MVLLLYRVVLGVRESENVVLSIIEKVLLTYSRPCHRAGTNNGGTKIGCLATLDPAPSLFLLEIYMGK